MARIINGLLSVEAYNPTGSPGEYTFTDAVFVNEADATGNGSLDIVVGFVVFVPAMDVNTMLEVPGCAHRYVITSIEAADGVHLSATILWDEDGSEIDLPLYQSTAILCEDTQNLNLGLYASKDVYPLLPGGIAEASHTADLRHIVDKLAQSITEGYIPYQGPSGYADSYLKQGHVDAGVSNTPIISYNSTPFITPPTGLTAPLLYQQYAPDFQKVVYSLSGQSLDMSAFNGFVADDLSGMTLVSGGSGGVWGMTSGSNGGYLLYMGTLAGTAGNFAAFDPFRSMMFVESGPGNQQSLVLGLANNTSDSSILSVATKSVSNRSSFYTYSTYSSMRSQIALVKTHNTDPYSLGTTLDSEDLGELRFQGINAAATPALSVYDSRIRAVQNGAAVASGVPVNLYFETSDGTAWNTNQFVLQSDGGSQLGFIKQGHVDVAGSNTPIISYNSTPFITPPTGLTGRLLYQQFAPSFTQSVTAALIDPVFLIENKGIVSDDLTKMILNADGDGRVFVLGNGYFLYGATAVGTIGQELDIGIVGTPYQLNRQWGYIDNGEGASAPFFIGGSSVFFGDFSVARTYDGNAGSSIAIVSQNTHMGEYSGPELWLTRSNGMSLPYPYYETINGQILGSLVFFGTPPGVGVWPVRGARIRAMQSGASTASFVPADTYIETNTGSAWNTNQIVAKSDGTVNIGTTASTQKLHVAGNVDIDSGNYYRVNNIQVLSARNTGWSTPTGTAVKANSGWSADTITATDGNIQTLAKAVKALIDAGITHGFLGA